MIDNRMKEESCDSYQSTLSSGDQTTSDEIESCKFVLSNNRQKPDEVNATGGKRQHIFDYDSANIARCRVSQRAEKLSKQLRTDSRNQMIAKRRKLAV